MGAEYPSGDKTPPAHRRCRCALVPATWKTEDRLRESLLNERTSADLLLEALDA